MATQRAMYTGVDNIMQGFDDMADDAQGFSLWKGNNMIMQYMGEDRDAGRAKLMQALEAANQNENSDLFTIKLHPVIEKKGFVTSKTPVLGTMFVRAYELDGVGNLPDNYNRAVVYQRQQAIAGVDDIALKMTNMLTGFEDRLKALEKPEPVEVDPIEKYLKYLENPAITGLITGIIGKIMPGIAGIMQTPVQSMQVAGIDEKIVDGHEPSQVQNPTVNDALIDTLSDENFNELSGTLDRLSVHCDVVSDLALLAKFAESNPAMFKGLISQLRG